MPRSISGIDTLFSAYAEVFLGPQGNNRGRVPFLCLRRGVSEAAANRFAADFFSLPTQRCFPPQKFGLDPRLLFSAYAEVFLRSG